MEIAFKNEIEMGRELTAGVAKVLQKCFGKEKYGGRTYYKQLPAFRLVASSKGKVVGHLGMDFRVMNLDGKPIKVLGAIDLCVDPKHRRRGIGKRLMEEFEKIAKENRHNVDFLFLVTDIPGFYAELGYKTTKPTVLWLRLHNHKSFGVAIERVPDCALMYKKVGLVAWSGRVLDMLGYWY